MVFTFNFLLAATITWSLIGLVMNENYHLQLSRIFDHWTIGVLSWIEALRL